MSSNVLAANDVSIGRRGQWSLVHHFKTEQGTEWAMKFRVVRFYTVPAHGRNSTTLEVVVHDEEGKRIHIQIKEQLSRYENYFKEGELFAIRNFIIKSNSQTYRTVDNENMIHLCPRTEAKKINPTGFPVEMFRFREFRDLCAMEVVDDHSLIGVIRLIVGRGRERTHSSHGRNDRLLEITLEDTEGIRLGCTLWGQYVDVVNNYMNPARNDVIIILQFCRPRRYDGSVSVSTSFHVTKILLDGNSEEVREFCSRLSRDVDEGSNIASFQLTSPTSNLREQLHQGKPELTKVADLLISPEVGTFWVLGDISSIENNVEWFYLGCSDCNKKVQPEGHKFRCTGCKNLSSAGVYRYKITASLLDSKTEAPIILWDTECSQLLGKTADEMREFMGQEKFCLSSISKKFGNPDCFPNSEVKSLVCTRGLFKIKIRKNAGEASYSGPKTFGISELITDPEVVRIYELAAEPIDDSFWNEADDVGDTSEKIGSSQNTLSSGVRDKRKPQVVIDDDDPLKKNLDEDFTAGNQFGKLKAVKIEKTDV